MGENDIQSLEDQLLEKYEEELIKAEAIVKTIQQKINTLREGRGLEPLAIGESNTAGNIPSRRKGSYLGLKLKEAIKLCLKTNHQLMRAKDIIQQLSDGGFISNAKNFNNGVSVALQSMNEEEVFSHQGKWGLIEWRGGKSKTTKDNSKEEIKKTDTKSTINEP